MIVTAPVGFGAAASNPLGAAAPNHGCRSLTGCPGPRGRRSVIGESGERDNHRADRTHLPGWRSMALATRRATVPPSINVADRTQRDVAPTGANRVGIAPDVPRVRRR